MEKKMNEKWLPHIIALGAFVVFIVLGLACATTPDTKPKKVQIPIPNFNSAEELKEYLSSQPDNSSYNPIKIAVTVDDSMLKDIMDVIKASGKNVNIDLSGNALTAVPANTFKDCTFISSITLPNNAEALKVYLSSQPANSPDNPIKVSMSIDDPALKNIVDAIKSANKYVNLDLTGKSLTTIPSNAFKDCNKLTGVSIPSSVDNINTSAFFGLENLTAINVYSGNRILSSDYGVLYDKDRTTLYYYPAGITGDYTIPNGVSAIWEKAFYGSSISGITIQGGSGAFFDVRASRFDVSKISIGKGAFGNCTKLTRVTIKGVVDLYSDSFDGNFYQFFEKNYTTLPNGQRAMMLSESAADGTYKTDGTYIRVIGSNTWTKQ